MILTTALLGQKMHKPIMKMCEANPGKLTDIQIQITNKIQINRKYR